MKFIAFYLVGLSCTTLGLSSCKKDEVAATPEYLVFGTSLGPCEVNDRCAKIYKLDTFNRQLSKDNSNLYPIGAKLYTGKYNLVSNVDYKKAQDLAQHLPAQLYAKVDTVLGHPAPGAWSGYDAYYVEVTRGGKRTFWIIDKQKENLPAELGPFVDELAAKFALLP